MIRNSTNAVHLDINLSACMIKFLPLEVLGLSQRILREINYAVSCLQISLLVPEIFEFEKCAKYANGVLMTPYWHSTQPNSRSLRDTFGMFVCLGGQQGFTRSVTLIFCPSHSGGTIIYRTVKKLLSLPLTSTSSLSFS